MEERPPFREKNFTGRAREKNLSIAAQHDSREELSSREFSKKERKKTDKQIGMGEEDSDRVHTCTSRILEGRPGAQVGLSCS